MYSSQFMDKQIMDLSASGGGGAGTTAGGELFDLMNPQDEHSNGGVLNQEDILPSYEFQPIRTVGSPSSTAYNQNGGARHSWGSADSNIGSSNLRYSANLEPQELPKVNHQKERGAYDVATVSEVDRIVKKYADNLLHALEGISSRLFQLEGRTHNLENSVDELKVTVGNNSGSTDGKLRQLENVLREVQTGVQVLRDKQELVESQLQLAKLQQHQPPESPKEPARRPDSTHQQHPAPPPPYQPPPQQPPPNAPPPPLPPQQNPPPQHPSQLQSDSLHFPPPGAQHYQLPQYSQPMSTNPSQLQPSMPRHSEESTPYTYPPPSQTYPPPSQTYPPSTCPSAPLAHPPPPVAPPQQPPPNAPPPLPPQHNPPSQHPVQLPRDSSYFPPPGAQHYQSPQYSQPISTNASQLQPSMPHQPEESAPYIQPPPNQTYPPSTHPQYYGLTSGQLSLPPGYGPPSGSNFSEMYPYSGGPSAMKPTPFSNPPRSSSNSGGYSHLPTAKLLPQAAQSGPSSGGGSGNRVPVDDVVDKVVTMGFSRDQVRATVRKLTENGQSVDLNVVLDKLMNGGA